LTKTFNLQPSTLNPQPSTFNPQTCHLLNNLWNNNIHVSNNKTGNMDANKILSTNLLDILFEGRNKDYGAYELRKSYDKRISIALFSTVIIIAILLIGSAIAGRFAPPGIKLMEGPDVVIKSIALIEPLVQPLQVYHPPSPPQKTVAFTTPMVVKDILAIKPPADVQQLIDAKIDVKTTGGNNDVGIVAPAEVINGSQVVAVVADKKDKDTVFYKVEIEATFPGGAGAWSKYVQEAVEGSIDEFTEPDFGTCVVKFIVDKTGKVSNVEAATMNGSKLAEIAVHAIRKGPDWTPAKQNGRLVSAYRLQPVTLTNPNQ
jgi:periplasmic protein TonB